MPVSSNDRATPRLGVEELNIQGVQNLGTTTLCFGLRHNFLKRKSKIFKSWLSPWSTASKAAVGQYSWKGIPLYLEFHNWSVSENSNSTTDTYSWFQKNRFFECTLVNGDYIYLSLVHTGSPGNLFHENSSMTVENLIW